MANFKIGTYNCKNFDGNQKTMFMSKLFQDCDFLCVQEHHKYVSEFDKFDKLDEKRTVMKEGKSAMDASILRPGRKHGGTMILWKGDIKYKVTPVPTLSNRLCCVTIELSDTIEMLLFCVYMPCDERREGESLHLYQDILSEIATICQSKDVMYAFIVGDFNTDFIRNSPQTRELSQFCVSENVYPLCKSNVSHVEYTYESVSNGARSHIDHVIVTENLNEYVNKYYTVDNIDNSSDHLPVIAEFVFTCEYLCTKKVSSTPRIAWYKASLGDLDKYKSCLDTNLDGFNVPTVATCTKINCCDKKHLQEIEDMHNRVIETCLNAAWSTLPSGGGKQTAPGGGSRDPAGRRPLPGFNEFVKERKDGALFWHWLWKDMGKPRTGRCADMRRVTRAQYHYAIRIVQKNESQLRSEKMSSAIASGNHSNLWQEVKRIKGKGNRIPKVVDGKSDEKDIAELFAQKFNVLYNSVGYNKDSMDVIMNDVNSHIRKCVNEDDGVCNNNDCLGLIDANDIKAALRKVKSNKHDGYLGLYSDHIINGTDQLYILLASLFNCMIIHGYSPDSMLVGTLIPIAKNKRVNINVSDNFRAVCLQSVLCKLLDIIILHKEAGSLMTCDLQFGFKEGLSAGLATSVFLETTDYYVRKGGNVYALALDASKAFDRVQYDKLFKLLIDRNVNPLYIRLLISMYIKQKLRVSFNNNNSDWFSVSNGVKQGGVLSPTLFGVYIDGMLTRLKESGIGCYIGDTFCGSMGYADDLTLLVPTVRGLVKMIDVCEIYAREFNIIFNGSKSKLLIFGNYVNIPDIYVGGSKVEVFNDMDYLGHKITNNIDDCLVKGIIDDFNVKVNTFLAYFSDLRCGVKNTLFKQYCTSFYGFHICGFYTTEIDKLYVAWRKALRKVWGLPSMTHNRLLPHITDSLPVNVMLAKRYIKHFMSGYVNKNTTVRSVFRSALYNVSRLGNNIRQICYDFNVDLSALDTLGANGIVKMINDVWNDNFDVEDKHIGIQIKELCNKRDSLDEWVLEEGEIRDIIQTLCTY